MKWLCWSVSFALAAATAFGAHPRLLPAVQKIEYGDGAMDVCRLKPAASTPDPFTASQLSHWRDGLCGASEPSPIAVTFASDSALPTESYKISIAKERVTLTAGSSAGWFYAFQTLRGLLESDNLLPVVEVEDRPALRYRGFMMDFAHGAVLTEDEVKRQLDTLARWKANQYYFYAETTIELPGYPLLKSAASWSPESIRRIVAYAAERHIDVVPCVELYGHLHDLFRQERYAQLAGLPHGGEINPRNTEAVALTEDWLRKLAALFPSQWLHIGMDEPWELERADPSIAKPEQFYLAQLKRLSALAVSLGKRPMFWADVTEGAFLFQRYPELYAQLPKEAVAVPWFYADAPDYTPLVKPFADHHVDQIVAPGIAIWEEVSPNFEQTFRNIDDFAAAGRKYGALGLLNTGWTDSAQSLYRQAIPAIAYGAIAAWQTQPIERKTFFADYARTEFPRAPGEAAQAFTAMARAQALLNKALGSVSMFRLWDDPLAPAALVQSAAHQSDLRECRLAVEEARLHWMAAQQAGQTVDEADLLAARMVDFAALKFIYAHEISESLSKLPAKPTSQDVDFYLGREAGARNHSRVSDLMDEAGELRAQYEVCWRAEYRPFRLATALARWDAEIEYWRKLQARLWEQMRAFERTGKRPSL